MLPTMRRRNTTGVLFYSSRNAALGNQQRELRETPVVKFQPWEIHPGAGISQSSSATLPRGLFFSKLFYLLPHPANAASPGAAALISCA